MQKDWPVPPSAESKCMYKRMLGTQQTHGIPPEPPASSRIESKDNDF